MLDGEACSIINIASVNTFLPLTKIPAYAAAKEAVGNFTKWLATYFAGTGIRVNAIAPGFCPPIRHRRSSMRRTV